jgi:hypothetical protein
VGIYSVRETLGLGEGKPVLRVWLSSEAYERYTPFEFDCRVFRFGEVKRAMADGEDALRGLLNDYRRRRAAWDAEPVLVEAEDGLYENDYYNAHDFGPPTFIRWTVAVNGGRVVAVARRNHRHDRPFLLWTEQRGEIEWMLGYVPNTVENLGARVAQLPERTAVA